ncbi:hypothetical protein [Listeria innocua]|uniref:hypothetical protein n=1 Tax=Listeria innocua TaxID=1642 RepID=UPI00086898BE|nr:hypothetical protein [Listeria innocua]EAH3474169.1 hypothetical protein [Listeria monocytogenes]EHE1063243.1 hypothetical protein [Listeria monocytogenes]MBF2435681.1 hypothetical protein [Listeria innocua]MDG0898346.1 hypothetical protein [Listeria innocua]MDH4595447.1 hypothetical protein [Listeria innocua]
MKKTDKVIIPVTIILLLLALFLFKLDTMLGKILLAVSLGFLVSSIVRVSTGTLNDKKNK